jgi:hypothetical protein
LQSQEVTPSSHHSIMRWLLESARPLFSPNPIIRNAFLLFVGMLVIMVNFTVSRIVPDIWHLGRHLSLAHPASLSGEYLKASLMFFAFVIFFIVPTFLVILGSLVAFLVFISQALISWSFGWVSLFMGLLVELAIEPLPFGVHSLTHISWQSSQLDGIFHSWTYTHPRAIQHIRDWVKESLNVCKVSAS